MSRNRRTTTTQVNYPFQLNNFQVLLDNGQTRNEPIENIRELDEIIRIYGRRIIAQITFYFHNNDRQFHNLILRNTGYDDKFVVEFYHYYNRHMERVEISREEKMRDFTTVMNYINNGTNLNSRLVPFIVDPFYQSVMMT
jgi:hypothetical protein